MQEKIIPRALPQMRATHDETRPSDEDPTSQAVQIMSELLLGNRVQQAIYVAARLRIADLLKDGPRSCQELADKSGSHPDALYRLLRALASYGVFVEEEPRRFKTTPLASLLETDSPVSLNPVALWSGAMAYRVFGGLEYSVRTGKPAFDELFGMEFFDYLARHPDMSQLFDAFMVRQTAPVARGVVGAYDFSGIELLVDVGGGRGELLAAILRAYPEMRGVLFDRPHVVRHARNLLRAAGVDDRCTTMGGDMSKSVPTGGSAYILKSIVHAAQEKIAIRWLKNCRRAIAGDGKLLLVEYVIPPGNGSHPGKLLDLVTLLGTHGGRERTAEEFEFLLNASGFRLTRIVETKTLWAVIEGIPV